MTIGKADNNEPLGGVQPIQPETGAAPVEKGARETVIEFPSSARVERSQGLTINAEAISSIRIESKPAASLEKFFPDIEEIDAEVEGLLAATNTPVPSLSQEVNKWGNEEVSLLYHEYVVAKKITGGVWSASDVLSGGLERGLGLAEVSAKVAGATESVYHPLTEKIEKDIFGISLAYKIPANLGKVAVLIYKRIFISRAYEILKNDPPGMSEEQKAEFKAFLKVESKEIADEAKKLAIEVGTSIPKTVNTALRLCQFNVPLLRLSLTWVDAVLGPVLGCYELYHATKGVIKVQQDISGFKAENFRGPGEVEARHANAVVNDNTAPELTADQVMEEAVKVQVREQATTIRNKRRDALLAKRDEPMPGAERSYVDGFDALIDRAFELCAEEEDGFAEAVQLLEGAGLHVDPDIKGEEALMAHLNDPEVRENMLARYIDEKSRQPLSDSARNALKTLTMKKQSVAKRAALRKLLKSKLMLTAAVATCIFTVVVTGLVASGVAVPLAVFFIPAVAMIGLGTGLLAVALIKFYRGSPNLFMEYVKGSFVKMAAYNIPKSIHELRRNLVAIRMLKNSLATGKLGIKEQQLAEDDPKREAMDLRRKKLEQEAAELEKTLMGVEEKIAYWEAKIEPIATGIAQARWKDFLQERPKRAREGGREFDDKVNVALPESIKEMAEGSPERLSAEAEYRERLKPIGSMKAADSTDEIMESLEHLRIGIMNGADSPLAEDMRKIVKERLGLDLEKIEGPELREALLAFAP